MALLGRLRLTYGWGGFKNLNDLKIFKVLDFAYAKKKRSYYVSTVIVFWDLYKTEKAKELQREHLKRAWYFSVSTILGFEVLVCGCSVVSMCMS